MRRHKTGMRPFPAGLIALGITLIVCYLGFTKAIPFKQHFEVKGVFTTSNNIAPNSPVRVAGVAIGKVVKVDHAKDGSQGAVVTMRSPTPATSERLASTRPNASWVDTAPLRTTGRAAWGTGRTVRSRGGGLLMAPPTD